MAQGHLDRLSPVDAAFLHQEGPTSHMHIGGVTIIEGPPPPMEEFLEQIRKRLHLVLGLSEGKDARGVLDAFFSASRETVVYLTRSRHERSDLRSSLGMSNRRVSALSPTRFTSVG